MSKYLRSCNIQYARNVTGQLLFTLFFPRALRRVDEETSCVSPFLLPFIPRRSGINLAPGPLRIRGVITPQQTAIFDIASLLSNSSTYGEACT